MTIYRVECPSCKNGPYTCGCARWRMGAWDLDQRHNTVAAARKRPGMRVDHPAGWVIYSIYLGCQSITRWYSGFSSHKQLDRWFDYEEQQIFKDNGFNFVAYNSDNFVVGRSGKQVFFLKGR